MNILDWIDIGKVSAERDDNLSHYYYDSGLLKRVIENKSCSIILGRKGAGKTAVFQFLSGKPSGIIGDRDILRSLSFDSYNWNIHKLLVNPDAGHSLAYRRSWRFVFVIESVNAFIDAYASHGEKLPPRITEAKKLLEKLFSSPLPSIYNIIAKKLLSITSLKLPNASFNLEDLSSPDISISGGEVTCEQVENDPSLRSRLSSNIDHIVTFVEKCIQDSLPLNYNVYIAFDRVDESWDSDSFESSKKVIAGLVSAAESFSRQYKGNIRVLVFLREDIFEVLDLNDLNKLREDSGSLLKWEADSLNQLILKRINYYSKLFNAGEYTDVNDIFNRKTMRQQTTPSNYIVKRTMMRPRDMICFYGKIINAMKSSESRHTSTTTLNKITVESIYEAEPEYSEWLKREIEDEWSVQFPLIKIILTAIRNIGSTAFHDDDLLKELVKLIPGYDRSRLSVDIKFLYDNSIIGFRLGASNVWRFKCAYPSQGFVSSKLYHVHDGLIRALNLIEPRGQ
jgi:hypothetical protein